MAGWIKEWWQRWKIHGNLVKVDPSERVWFGTRFWHFSKYRDVVSNCSCRGKKLYLCLLNFLIIHFKKSAGKNNAFVGWNTKPSANYKHWVAPGDRWGFKCYSAPPPSVSVRRVKADAYAPGCDDAASELLILACSASLYQRQYFVVCKQHCMVDWQASSWSSKANSKSNLQGEIAEARFNLKE